MDNVDQALWDAVVAAERDLAQRRADFADRTRSRAATLSAALTGSNDNRAAALAFLNVFHQDVPDLVEQLVDLAASDRWSRLARQALSHGLRDRVLPEVRRIVRSQLSTMDAVDHARLSQVLIDLEDWQTLRLLVDTAAAHDDPDARDVANDLTAAYGPLLHTAES